MSAAALAQDARTECYNDLREMLFDIVHKFVRRYRVEFEEALSIAHLAFCKAFDGFTRKKSSFRTWVYHKVWNELLEWQRTTTRRKILTPLADVELSRLPSGTAFEAVDFLDELSADGRLIVKAILNSPKDIIHDLVNNGMSPTTYRRAVREFFEDCGWDTSRILKGFEEVKGVL